MTEKNTVIVVDDDDDIREMIQKKLEHDSYKVVTASSAQELLEIIKVHHADTILLDLGLPDEDGLVLIGKIRNFTDAPVIVVSGRGELVDRVVGLEMGADDYVSKPFQMRELSARVKANVRRYKANIKSLPHAPSGKRIKFGSWTLDSSTVQVYDENHEAANLTTQEFKLLEILVNKPNCVLSREYLFDILKDGDYESYDRAIDVQITRIRKKLGDSAKSPSLIKTVRGIGYILICKTQILE